MAKIKPFKGVRPPKEFIEEVASRPYDVLNSQEARVEAEGNEKSLYHIIKPEIDFPEGTDEHDPAVYLKAAANFNNFQEKGWLVQDQKECYYVYAQTMNGKTQYGLVVGAYVPDYMNGTTGGTPALGRLFPAAVAHIHFTSPRGLHVRACTAPVDLSRFV